MKKIKINLIYLFSFILIISCDSTELNLTEDPNGASPSDANVSLLLNGAMINFKNFNKELTDFGMQVTRMTHMSGPVYDNAYTPQSFNDLWEEAYAGVLADTKIIIAKGIKEKMFNHVAIAKILQSYVLTSLVDMFGDVPYSESILFTENFNPKADDDKDIYMIALNLLKEAINDFNKTSLKGLEKGDDIFYYGNVTKWESLANTLQLRLYNNMRLSDPNTAAINTLIAGGKLILASNDDFQISYRTQNNDPDLRHFKFKDNYLSDDKDYMSNYFMNLLKNGKSVEDPRLHYYFYRQTLTYPDPSTSDGLFTLPCLGESKPLHYAFNDPFCNIGNGYWGRDHGNNDGGPPDGGKVTVWGLYPAGGKYDNNEGSSVGKNDGAKGKGIYPIWNSANTNFLLAESALTLGTSGNAKEYLENGIKESMSKVRNFNKGAIPSGTTLPTDANVTSYIKEVLTKYDAANDSEKLNIIMTESYIANWGNGLEVYNAYRRTSKPSNLQPTISATPGVFIRSFMYPGNFANLNSSVSPKSGNNIKIFWDLNADNLN